MRFVVVFLLVLWSEKNFSQDTIYAKTPLVLSKLYFGESLYVDEVELKFVKVESDSRCPKNVNCVRAGEAIIEVEIYLKEVFIERKSLMIRPTNYSLQERIELLIDNENEIYVYNLLPYPINGEKTAVEDYFLQLDIISH